MAFEEGEAIEKSDDEDFEEGKFTDFLSESSLLINY